MESKKDEYFMVEFYNFHDTILTKPTTFPERNHAPSKGGEIEAGDLQKMPNGSN
jgi:hypothetical protein